MSGESDVIATASGSFPKGVHARMYAEYSRTGREGRRGRERERDGKIDTDTETVEPDRRYLGASCPYHAAGGGEEGRERRTKRMRKTGVGAGGISSPAEPSPRARNRFMCTRPRGSRPPTRADSPRYASRRGRKCARASLYPRPNPCPLSRPVRGALIKPLRRANCEEVWGEGGGRANFGGGPAGRRSAKSIAPSCAASSVHGYAL